MPYSQAARFWRARLWCLALTLAIAAPHAGARPKKDIIYFKNGDRWTCEIQKLDRAYLYVNLDYVDGTVSVDWSKVARVESPQLFVVRDAHGDLFRGPIVTPAGPTAEGAPGLTVGAAERAQTLPESTVVSIQQTESNFWQGIHGDISGGLNYAKSDQQTEVSFDTSARYQKEFWSAQAAYNASFSGSLSSASDLREELSLLVSRALTSKENFVALITDVQKNDEQQLDLRSTLGGGFGHLLRDTDSSRMYWLGGAAWTRERYSTDTDSMSTDSTSKFNSAEAVAGIGFQYFRFKTTNFQITLTTYPSLTDPGRVRADGNATVKFQLVKNLYWNFTTYINYDSRPPRATTKSDFGSTSSLGWTF